MTTDEQLLAKILPLIQDIKFANQFRHLSTTGFAEPGYVTSYSGIVVACDWPALPKVFQGHRKQLEILGVRTEGTEWGQCLLCKKLFLNSPDGPNWLRSAHGNYCVECLKDNDHIFATQLEIELEHEVPFLTFQHDEALIEMGYVQIANWLVNDHASMQTTACPRGLSTRLRHLRVDQFVNVIRFKKEFGCSFDTWVHRDQLKLIDGKGWTAEFGIEDKLYRNLGRCPPGRYLKLAFTCPFDEYTRKGSRTRNTHKRVNSYFVGDKFASDLVVLPDDDINPIEHKALWTPWQYDWAVLNLIAFPPSVTAGFVDFMLGLDSHRGLGGHRYDPGTRKSLPGNWPILSSLDPIVHPNKYKRGSGRAPTCPPVKFIATSALSKITTGFTSFFQEELHEFLAYYK